MITANVLKRISKLEQSEDYDQLADCISVLMGAALEGRQEADLIFSNQEALRIVEDLKALGYRITRSQPAAIPSKTWYTVGWR